jgi:hypothetical protein
VHPLLTGTARIPAEYLLNFEIGSGDACAL